MNVKEAKAAKQQLKEDLQDVLTKFSKDTGLLVDSINLAECYALGSGCSYVVNVEVML